MLPHDATPLNGGERDATLEQHRSVLQEKEHGRGPRRGLPRSNEAVERMVKVGDHVVVESEKVGSATRSGVVTAVDGRLLTVRWESGDESMFIPSAGSLSVTSGETATPEQR